MICLFTNGLLYFLSLSTKVGILSIVERTDLNRKMAGFLNLIFLLLQSVKPLNWKQQVGTTLRDCRVEKKEKQVGSPYPF